jgi:hypothetical protein
VDFEVGWCDPFDCNDTRYLAVIWAARVLAVTGLGWTAYRVVRRTFRVRHELLWLAGFAMIAVVSYYRTPVHGYVEVPLLTVLLYAVAAGIRMVSSVSGFGRGGVATGVSACSGR